MTSGLCRTHIKFKSVTACSCAFLFQNRNRRSRCGPVERAKQCIAAATSEPPGFYTALVSEEIGKPIYSICHVYVLPAFTAIIAVNMLVIKMPIVHCNSKHA